METLTLLIFAVGALVLVLSLVGVLLIGLREAADPDQAQPGDLTEFERSIVNRRKAPGSQSPDQPPEEPTAPNSKARTGNNG